MSFEITSRDAFVDHFREWRERHPLDSQQVSDLLGISRLRVHLYETGYFKFDVNRENAVFRRMLESAAPMSHGVHGRCTRNTEPGTQNAELSCSHRATAAAAGFMGC